MKIKSSFTLRLSLYVILFSAFLFLLSASVSCLRSAKLIEKEATESAFGQLKCVNLEIENILTKVSTALDNIAITVADELNKENPNPELLYEYTRFVVEKNSIIIGSVIALEPFFYKDKKYFAPYTFRNDSSIVSLQIGNDRYDYSCMDWYLIPKLLKKPYWSDPFYDEGASNIIMCTYSYPLYKKNGDFIGVITADLPMEWLSEMVNSIKPYENSWNIMIGKDGAFIAHPNSERILKETIFTNTYGDPDTTIFHMGREMISGHTGMDKFKKNKEYIFYAPIKSSGWSMAIICPSNDIFVGVRQMYRELLILTLIGLILLFVFVFLIIKQISKPLELFSISARHVAEGEFNSPLPEIKSEDEMKELHDSFLFMQKSLTNYISELQQTTAVKERIESELNIAREIQMGMIPKIFPPFPDRNDVDLYAILQPAKEVGGDLYDFFIDKEHLYLVIGDVSGKGVPASLFMAVTRSLFRSIATSIGIPSKIIESMNNAISESNEANMFVTLFVAILDLKTGNMEYCNAGHNPPVIIDKHGVARFMNILPNLPVGLFNSFEYEDEHIQLCNGDMLFLYTDGLTEAENPKAELYTEQRLLEKLPIAANLNSEETIRSIIEDVTNHVNGADQSDDLTILSVRYDVHSEDNTTERRLVIKNQVPELEHLTEFIDQIGEEFNLGAALTGSMNLAMEEAVSNVVLYAYPAGEINHTIEIIFCKNSDHIKFTIIDRGAAFDPTAKKDADITLSAEDRGIGGLGIFMVKQIMDTVEYRRIEDKNVLSLTKNFISLEH